MKGSLVERGDFEDWYVYRDAYLNYKWRRAMESQRLQTSSASEWADSEDSEDWYVYRDEYLKYKWLRAMESQRLQTGSSSGTTGTGSVGTNKEDLPEKMEEKENLKPKEAPKPLSWKNRKARSHKRASADRTGLMNVVKNSDWIGLNNMVKNSTQEECLHTVKVEILMGHMPRKYPSCVRVSADRSFPIGCRRQVDAGNKKEVPKAGILSGSKNAVDEIASIDSVQPNPSDQEAKVGGAEFQSMTCFSSERMSECDEKVGIGRTNSSVVDVNASIIAVESQSISSIPLESRSATDEKAWIEGVKSGLGDEKARIDVGVSQPIASVSSQGETMNDQKAQIERVDLCVGIELADTGEVEIEIADTGEVESQLLIGWKEKECENLERRRKRKEQAQTGNKLSKKAKGSSSLLNIEGEAFPIEQGAQQVTMDGNGHLDGIVTRKKVKETLCVFQTIYRKLLQEQESKSKELGQGLRADLMAFKLFKERCEGLGKGRKYLGIVPGVEVGDQFHLRVEMCIIGLHCQHQAGIDYTKQAGRNIAVSIVSSGRYANDVGYSDVLEYSGCGVSNQHQKLERGNLALKNSMDAQTPVRVIHGFRGYQASNSQQTRSKTVVTYIYHGLYLVENYWRKIGKDGHYVFIFQLRRIPGQPELAINKIRREKMLKARSGLYAEDVSHGEEKIPIPIVNTVDDEHPMPFKYIKKLMYPSIFMSTPRGCDCVDGCSNSEKCACAVKNGGEIPFNYDGAIVEAKPLIYECGPSCKCPPSCHNRVSQHGIKFPLEIFKTESRGWGVRSLASIPSGSFICEYIGELVEDEEAERRVNDEYLFTIGNNYHEKSLWEGLSTYIPDLQNRASFDGVDEACFTIDAYAYGNIGRFINHSCSPNLYAQNLLYDHDNKSMPHIMFFASENIPPLQELTYHYNYAIDQVYDSDGNIKKKNCHCGSSECTGRLY